MHWQGTSVLTKDLVGDRHRLMRCPVIWYSLQWRHNGLDDVSNHQPHHCLLSRLLGRRSKKTSKLRVAGLCAGNSPMASKMENASIWWSHHVLLPLNVAVKILHMKQVIIFCIVSFRASWRWFLLILWVNFWPKQARSLLRSCRLFLHLFTALLLVFAHWMVYQLRTRSPTTRTHH